MTVLQLLKEAKGHMTGARTFEEVASYEYRTASALLTNLIEEWEAKIAEKKGGNSHDTRTTREEATQRV